MVGSVNPRATLEILADAARWVSGAYYLTFPDASGPIRFVKLKSILRTVTRLLKLCQQLDGNDELAAAISRQADAVASQRIVNDIMPAR